MKNDSNLSIFQKTIVGVLLNLIIPHKKQN